MRILIGVQGTGNGHLSRCSALAEALATKAVQVDYLVSGRAPEHFFDMEAFGNWQWRKGLSFAVKNGRIDLPATLQQNDWRQFWRDVNALDLSDYDLVVSDYEPVVAWAAKRQGKRCIGMGRQYAFFGKTQSLRLPWMYQHMLRWFAPATESVGMHWISDGPHIVPPIVHQRAAAQQPTSGHFLVYLPFESLLSVHRLLVKFPHYTFSVFHPEAKRQRIAGIEYYPPSRLKFAEQFVRAEGVISNAGFETSCEALTYGKKLLVRPLAGQFEQQANAQCLEELGLASQMANLSVDGLADWFATAQAQQCYWPNVAEALAQWLATGAEESVSDLSRRLWKRAEVDNYRALLRAELLA